MRSLPESCLNSYNVNHNVSTYFLHLTIALEFPFSLFSIYCICKLTPKHLILSKYLLLTHQFWVTFYSVVICIGLLPVTFFPYMAFYSQGVFEYFELSLTMIIYLIGTGFAGMLFTIMSLFAYRHRSVLPDNHFLKLKTKTFTNFSIFLNFITFLFIVPFIISVPDQENSLIILRDSYSNPPCDLWHPRIIIYWFEVKKQVIGYLSFLIFCSILMLFFVFHSFHIMRVCQNITSKNTRKKQIGFLYALILMATIPNVFLFAPSVILVICSVGSYSYNAVLGDIIVCVVGLHGLLSTITLILSHNPFRLELVSLIRRILFQKKKQTKQFNLHCDQVTKSARF